MSEINRKKTVPVQIGNVWVGGDSPIVVQSMTNTDTADIDATVAQVRALAEAGSELVRMTVNTEAAAAAVPFIRERLLATGCSVPLIGDFHYNGHQLLAKHPACAEALAKYRINPGNVGFGHKQEKQFAQMIEMALEYNKPVRIGVNWGSLDQGLVRRKMDKNAARSEPWSAERVMHDCLISSALESAAFAEKLGLPNNKIILSCKVSGVQRLIRLYEDLAARSNYALHLGLTEAGLGMKGQIATATAFAVLLQQGIGDTVRASLTPEPGGDRSDEVRACQHILQSMELRRFRPEVAACPGCGRTTSDYYQQLATRIETYLQKMQPEWQKKYPGAEKLQVAVMGCVVNGPGESKHANIGISLPGTGEAPVAPVFIDGKKALTLRGDRIAEEFQALVLDYVTSHFGRDTKASPSDQAEASAV